MKIALNYQQRLNLVGLVGSQKGTVSDMRLLWPLMDKLDLSAEEKAEINYRVVPNGEYSVPTWDAHEVKDVEVDLTPEEITRVKRLLEEWPTFRPVDRIWLEPLWAKLG